MNYFTKKIPVRTNFFVAEKRSWLRAHIFNNTIKQNVFSRNFALKYLIIIILLGCYSLKPVDLSFKETPYTTCTCFAHQFFSDDEDFISAGFFCNSNIDLYCQLKLVYIIPTNHHSCFLIQSRLGHIVILVTKVHSYTLRLEALFLPQELCGR